MHHIFENYEATVRHVVETQDRSNVTSSEFQLFCANFSGHAYLCPFVSCVYATSGFNSSEERQLHESGHTLSFPCSEPGCQYPPFGSHKALRRHLSEKHPKDRTKRVQLKRAPPTPTTQQGGINLVPHPNAPQVNTQQNMMARNDKDLHPPTVTRSSLLLEVKQKLQALEAVNAPGLRQARQQHQAAPPRPAARTDREAHLEHTSPGQQQSSLEEDGDTTSATVLQSRPDQRQFQMQIAQGRPEPDFLVDPLARLRPQDRNKVHEVAVRLMKQADESLRNQIQQMMQQKLTPAQLDECAVRRKDTLLIWYQNMALSQLRARGGLQGGLTPGAVPQAPHQGQMNPADGALTRPGLDDYRDAVTVFDTFLAVPGPWRPAGPLPEKAAVGGQPTAPERATKNEDGRPQSIDELRHLNTLLASFEPQMTPIRPRRPRAAHETTLGEEGQQQTAASPFSVNTLPVPPMPASLAGAPAKTALPPGPLSRVLEQKATSDPVLRALMDRVVRSDATKDEHDRFQGIVNKVIELSNLDHFFDPPMTPSPPQELKAEQESIAGEEKRYKTKCICNFVDDEPLRIACNNCATWQHAECYYPDQAEDGFLRWFEHSCVDCKPRPLDRQRAIARMSLRGLTPSIEPPMTVLAPSPPREPRAEQESIAGEEKPFAVKCICDFPHDDGNSIFCEPCETWQHIECYYPDHTGGDILHPGFSHSCVDCEPRTLDRQRATGRLMRRGLSHHLTAFSKPPMTPSPPRGPSAAQKTSPFSVDSLPRPSTPLTGTTATALAKINLYPYAPPEMIPTLAKAARSDPELRGLIERVANDQATLHERNVFASVIEPLSKVARFTS